MRCASPQAGSVEVAPLGSRNGGSVEVEGERQGERGKEGARERAVMISCAKERMRGGEGAAYPNCHRSCRPPFVWRWLRTRGTDGTELLSEEIG